MLEVIPERSKEGLLPSGFIMGHADNYLQIVFEGSEDLAGELCQVQVTSATANGCQGKLIRVLEHVQAKAVNA
ncbi:Threonylcarbamoyladenosine tRNA methylthiotransferase MtaB [compost metagenome]